MLRDEARIEKRPFSANYVAKRMGVSHNTVLAYIEDEKDIVSATVLAKFCEYLKCQPSDLLYLDEGNPELAAAWN